MNSEFESVDYQKKRLQELKLERKELQIKDKVGMPMTLEECGRFETIEADIQQILHLIEWMESSDEADWLV